MALQWPLACDGRAVKQPSVHSAAVQPAQPTAHRRVSTVVRPAFTAASGNRARPLVFGVTSAPPRPRRQLLVIASAAADSASAPTLLASDVVIGYQRAACSDHVGTSASSSSSNGRDNSSGRDSTGSSKSSSSSSSSRWGNAAHVVPHDPRVTHASEPCSSHATSGGAAQAHDPHAERLLSHSLATVSGRGDVSIGIASPVQLHLASPLLGVDGSTLQANRAPAHTGSSGALETVKAAAAGPGRPASRPPHVPSSAATGTGPAPAHHVPLPPPAADSSMWRTRLQRPAVVRLRPGCARSPSHLSALAAALWMEPARVEQLLRKHPELSVQDPAAMQARVQQLAAALECTPRQAAFMVASYPSCYLLQPLKRVTDRVQQLADSLGLRRQQVVAWTAATPSVLKRPSAAVAQRLQRLSSWLGAAPSALLPALQATPELLTVRLATAQRRGWMLQRLLLLKDVQAQRLLLVQPQLLFVSPRILLSKVRMLQAIFGKDRRAVGRLVYTTPQLLRCNINHVRQSYQQLQLRLQRSPGYVFAMCCHNADLLLLPGHKLSARVAAVRQAAALLPAWAQEWAQLKPPQLHACLAAGQGRYRRLHYLLSSRNAHQVGLQQALQMAAAAWQERFPLYASWRQQQQQQGVQAGPNQRPVPLPGSGQHYQQQSRPSAPLHMLSSQQLQQQWALAWQCGANRHQSWARQRQAWDQLQQAQQREWRRQQEQVAWLSAEDQGQLRAAAGQHKWGRLQHASRQQQQQQSKAVPAQRGQQLPGTGSSSSNSSSSKRSSAALEPPLHTAVAAGTALQAMQHTGTGEHEELALHSEQQQHVMAVSLGSAAAVSRPADSAGVLPALVPPVEVPGATGTAQGTRSDASHAASALVDAQHGAAAGSHPGGAVDAATGASTGAAAAGHTLDASSGAAGMSGHRAEAAGQGNGAGAAAQHGHLANRASAIRMGQYRAMPGHRRQVMHQQPPLGHQQHERLAMVHASHQGGLSVE